MSQKLYNGVHLLGQGPCLDNVERIDLGALPMISHMMKTGLQVDLSHFQKMDTLLTQDMERLTESVHDMTGYYVNLGSGDQVADLLFKKLGLKQIRPKMTKGGSRESVENEVLVAIQHDHEAVPAILEYKEVEKLNGTYVRPMPGLAKKRGLGRYYLYPNLGCTRVPSSRLNCREPNLLAMPNRTERGRQVCEGFICESNQVYLSVDFSQIEPRLAGHLSQDPNLLKIYRNNEDIYSDFATAAFKLPDKRYPCNGCGKVSKHGVCDNKDHKEPSWHYPSVHKKDHRFPAKTCILASFYDVSGKGLLEQMPIICANCQKEATKHDCGKFASYWTENMCTDLINAFGMRYEEVIRMRMQMHRTARKHAFIWDMWGRLLHVAAVRSAHNWVISAALREAANFPIQSGAQGIMKLAMAMVMDALRIGRMLGVIIDPVLQIHDELLFVVLREYAEEMGAFISDLFESVVELSIPIKASTAMANNWGSMPK